jgi:hypothetical protein
MPDEPKAQADKFRDFARELEVGEGEAHFEDAVRKIVEAPPPKANDKQPE